MIKAIIYDVDGTMVDSEPLHVAAWDKALQLYDHHLNDLSEDLRATMAGKKPAVIAQEMVQDLKLTIDSETLLMKKTEIFMELIKTDLKGMPGIVDSIHRLKQAGYKLAIGTSLSREYLTIVLTNLNVQQFFDIIVTGDEIKNGKPHPETYLVVAEKLGVNPAECVVIEDAQSGIKSAKAAGCVCIAITNSNALPQDTSLADKMISSHDSLTKEFIEKSLRYEKVRT